MVLSQMHSLHSLSAIALGIVSPLVTGLLPQPLNWPLHLQYVPPRF